MELDFLFYTHSEGNILAMIELVNQFFEAEKMVYLARSTDLVDRTNCIYSTLALYINMGSLTEILLAMLHY